MFRFSSDATGLGCDITIIARLHIKFGHCQTKNSCLGVNFLKNNILIIGNDLYEKLLIKFYSKLTTMEIKFKKLRSTNYLQEVSNSIVESLLEVFSYLA